MSLRLICKSDELIDGETGVRFALDRFGVSEPAFVIRYRGRVHAYLNRCAHIPVEIDWQPGRFFDHSGLYLICATHGALYAPDTGHCLGGRCNGKGLDALAVTESDGRVYLIGEGSEGV